MRFEQPETRRKKVAYRSCRQQEELKGCMKWRLACSLDYRAVVEEVDVDVEERVGNEVERVDSEVEVDGEVEEKVEVEP